MDLNITKNVNTNKSLQKQKKSNIHTLTEGKKKKRKKTTTTALRPCPTDNYTVKPLDSRLCVTEIIWR